MLSPPTVSKEKSTESIETSANRKSKSVNALFSKKSKQSIKFEFKTKPANLILLDSFMESVSYNKKTAESILDRFLLSENR